MLKIACIECGIEFGVPDNYYLKHLREEHNWFCCPNGHKMQYSEKSKVELLQEEVDNKDRQIERLSSNLDTCQARNKQSKRTIIAMQGHKTRLKNKLAYVKGNK